MPYVFTCLVLRPIGEKAFKQYCQKLSLLLSLPVNLFMTLTLMSFSIRSHVFPGSLTE